MKPGQRCDGSHLGTSRDDQSFTRVSRVQYGVKKSNSGSFHFNFCKHIVPTVSDSKHLLLDTMVASDTYCHSTYYCCPHCSHNWHSLA